MSKDRDTYFKYRKDKFLDKLSKNRREKKESQIIKKVYSRASDAPMHIALVVDGIVEDIMHCDERLAMLLMSEPVVIEIESDSKVSVGWAYDEENERFYDLADE
jgi:hypothetical protein